MTVAELQAIWERCERATPGPWEWHRRDPDDDGDDDAIGLIVDGGPFVMQIHADLDNSGGLYIRLGGDEGYSNYNAQWQADSNFIAHSRADVPALRRAATLCHPARRQCFRRPGSASGSRAVP